MVMKRVAGIAVLFVGAVFLFFMMRSLNEPAAVTKRTVGNLSHSGAGPLVDSAKSGAPDRWTMREIRDQPLLGQVIDQARRGVFGALVCVVASETEDGPS